MRSKAHIRSHPLHPILIPFPIAFFTGTLLFDVAGILLSKPDLLRTAHLLNGCGIATAILAAIPGIIDFIYTVPPQSSAKKRAAKHGAINLTTLLIFIVVFIYRQDSETERYIVIGLDALGVTLMMTAGWMGGTLVHRNQIGVDIRYAHAGKWKEAYFKERAGLIEGATTDELKVNAMKLLHIGEKRIVLARTEDHYVAFEDRCTHKGGSLAGGSLMCGTVQCPWHGSQFKVQTGEVTAGPAIEKIKTYAVSEKDGKVYVAV